MLEFVATPPNKFGEGDLVCFDYANGGQNTPRRVGVVIEFRGPNLLLWDYSVVDGPQYRSYRLTFVRGAGKILSVQPRPNAFDVLTAGVASILERG